MKTYIVNIETRKNDRDDLLGPYRTFEEAKKLCGNIWIIGRMKI